MAETPVQIDEMLEVMLKGSAEIIDTLVAKVHAGGASEVFSDVLLMDDDLAHALLAVAIVSIAADRAAHGEHEHDHDDEPGPDEAGCDRCGAPAVECVGGTDYACANCLDQVAAAHAAPADEVDDG